MNKSKAPRKPVEITCPHCGSQDVAFDATVEISTSTGDVARTRKADRYTCFTCRQTFERPQGEFMRTVAVEDFTPPIELPENEPETPAPPADLAGELE